MGGDLERVGPTGGQPQRPSLSFLWPPGLCMHELQSLSCNPTAAPFLEGRVGSLRKDTAALSGKVGRDSNQAAGGWRPARDHGRMLPRI